MSKNIITLAILFFLILATFTSAQGFSTGNTDDSISKKATAEQVKACESGVSVKDRVACRIKIKATSVQSIEESCRNLANPESCVRFQKAASPCYEEPAQTKALCLRKHMGFGQGQLNQATTEERRKYAALLMYELQERVEKKQDAGQLTEEQAAELIAMIVNIKESLLSDEVPIADIQEMMVKFKQAWREAMTQ